MELIIIIILLALGIINGIQSIINYERGKLTYWTMFGFFVSGFCISGALYKIMFLINGIR